ncbi:hypothetical protein, partial [Rhizobium johnstonii]|uniref:hypothetical protein n=1 Tax=Rhizobium johnstonii TaxID=3019933 RepID=UPI003F9664DE
TVDGLPLIGPVPETPHVFAAYGYGGNGITFSYLSSFPARTKPSPKRSKPGPSLSSAKYSNQSRCMPASMAPIICAAR